MASQPRIIAGVLSLLLLCATQTFAYECYEGQCAQIEAEVAAQTNQTKFTIGDRIFSAMYLQTIVTKNVSESITYSYLTYRAKFYPEVDQFSVMRSPGSGAIMDNAGGFSSYIFAEVNGFFTCKRPHYKNSREFNSFYTVVATLEDGKVDKVEWSDGAKCSVSSTNNCTLSVTPSCTSSYCSYNNIPICNEKTFPDDKVLIDKESANCPESKECDPKIYLAFIGPDKNGDPTTSTNLIFSNFQSFGVDYSQLVKSATKIGASIPYDDIPIPSKDDIPDLPDIPDVPDLPDPPKPPNLP